MNTTVRPQLAKHLDTDKLAEYVDNERYWFEEKYDGVRLLLHYHSEDGTDKIYGTNRRDSVVTLPSRLRLIMETVKDSLIDGIVIDGEYVNGMYYAFDLPYLKINGKEASSIADVFADRRILLESFAEQMFDGHMTRIVVTSRTPEDKYQLVCSALENRAEGIMVKDSQARYTSGRRTEATLKAKFTKTLDAVVIEQGREGKQSCSVGVFDNGKLVDIGSIKVVAPYLEYCTPGTVVEVRYLYATDADKIYQPVFLKIRTDKDAKDCTLDQLIYTGRLNN